MALLALLALLLVTSASSKFLASLASLASMATLDATALSATLLLSALALLLSALAMSASNLKSKQSCPHVTYLWGRVGCGVWGEYFLLSLDSTQSSEMHYKMQNKDFLTGYHKWPNTASWRSVRISFMDISMMVTKHLSSWREFTFLNSPKGFWISLPEISLLLFFFS